MNESVDKELTIITPEQVQLQFQTAGIGSRAIAHLLDTLLLFIFNVILFLFALVVSRLYVGNWLPEMADYLIAIAIILFVLLNLGYFICTEAYMGGQTPGKKMMGLRVLQNNGQSATLLSILIRNLFRLLDMLPSAYFLGAVFIFFSARDKRVGDMVAGTIVIIETRVEGMKRRRQIDKMIVKRNFAVIEFQLEDALRHKITLADWQLLQAWMERVPSMHRVRLHELAVPIALHFSGKLEQDALYAQDPVAYLIAVYKKIRQDWEV
ncbi:RDD family protein [Paenibacillus sp. N3.4]|uniref:RDD family protein n=1 Tax=Paenibacillus sp. N3.4 TaxID=2603222 RepID=UPI0011C8AF83|nr:RDD family protein [Paenibacillus sp. N3.4]TXK80997.1 RDD family protein [Paenibacillus sp. N3.4]